MVKMEHAHIIPSDLKRIEASKPQFCHICPTPHLDLVDGRSVHLVLAHLIETDPSYVKFYLEQKQKYNCTIIMDNSAFEMYKQGRPMYESDKLISMGLRIDADYIVMSDYPGEESSKTIEAAEQMAPLIKAAGFKTFYVPQSKIGDMDDYLEGFKWGCYSDLVDYIGVSILGVPNAFGNIEKENRLQRFMSRLALFYKLANSPGLDTARYTGKKFHMLGMVDGPQEIMFMNPFRKYINTWDSSAAVWAGLNGITFDNSPTGLINGKFEKEVDFDFKTMDYGLIEIARKNMSQIDKLVWAYLWEN
jgi:hypothetical protein